MNGSRKLPLVEASILQPILNWLAAGGGNVQRHLDRANIPGELVFSGGWLSKVQAYAFIADVAQRERCEELGFAACSQFGLVGLGPIAAAMQSAVTCGESLAIFCRLVERYFEGTDCWIEARASEVRLCNRTVDDLGRSRAHAQHLSLTILWRVVAALAGPECRPRRVRVQASQTRAIRRVPGLEECQASFNQEHNAVAFPRELLHRRVVAGHTPVGVTAKADFGLDDLPREQGSFAASLRRLLASWFPMTELPKLEEASAIIGVGQ